MNGHTFEVYNGGEQVIYQHFDLPDHSILSRKKFTTQIKIQHLSHFRRQRENNIGKLGTAIPCGCNDLIDSLGKSGMQLCEYNDIIQPPTMETEQS